MAERVDLPEFETIGGWDMPARVAMPVVRGDGEVFASINKAARSVYGGEPSEVKRCCDGSRHTAYGYEWRYLEAVRVGDVRTFDVGDDRKQQAKKVVEEACEVLSAVERDDHEGIVSEAADVITAVCNLLAMVGVRDAREAMRSCSMRNAERGRF